MDVPLYGQADAAAIWYRILVRCSHLLHLVHFWVLYIDY